jgi:cell division protease FtsH
MVGRWGISEAIGLVSIAPSDGYGSPRPGLSETFETTQRLVDHEVHRLTAEAHVEVTELLLAHREQLEGLAGALLEVETLDGATLWGSRVTERYQLRVARSSHSYDNL